MAKKDDLVVEPLKSKPDAPEPKNKGEICWNCKNQDSETDNRLNDDNVCDVCGFEKDTLYNGNLEADKAAQRAEAARAAERI